MIDLVKSFFGKRSVSRGASHETRGVHDVRVATCALFLEMAGIDEEFTDSERERILLILRGNYGLSEDHAAELMDLARRELDQSIDLWQFTNLINENYTKEEKTRIIEMVWEIVYTDDKLDQHEDYLVHKLAKLLGLSHKQLIDAKLKILHGES
jgi:uncharacterized tellurite resistance protein B-like protein